MEVLPSRFLNVVLEETDKQETKTAKDREVPMSSTSSLTIPLASAVPKPVYFRLVSSIISEFAFSRRFITHRTIF